MGKEKEKEERNIPWEVADPKPPVIRSGHLENKWQHKNGKIREKY